MSGRLCHFRPAFNDPRWVGGWAPGGWATRLSGCQTRGVVDDVTCSAPQTGLPGQTLETIRLCGLDGEPESVQDLVPLGPSPPSDCVLVVGLQP